MEIMRLAGYLVALVASAALIGRLVGVDRKLARVLVVFTAAWAINAMTLLSFLIWTLATGLGNPPWREALLTVDAFLMAICPLALYRYLGDSNGR